MTAPPDNRAELEAALREMVALCGTMRQAIPQPSKALKVGQKALAALSSSPQTAVSSSEPLTGLCTKPYQQGGDRTLIRHLMPQGHWIVWNWNTHSWDEKSNTEMEAVAALSSPTSDQEIEQCSTEYAPIADDTSGTSGAATARTDDFNGDDAHLIRSIDALLDLDDAKALVPHGLGKGSHAYRLLVAARCRLEATDPSRGLEEADVERVAKQATAEILNCRDWADATDYRTTGAFDQNRDRIYKVVIAALGQAPKL